MGSESKLFTVGPPPHWRSRVSVTQMNIAFILAIAPAALFGAIFQAKGATGLPEMALGPWFFSGWIRLAFEELGMEGWMFQALGSLGLLAIGAGAGLVIEYIVQVAFRQPYHALNGHGALMGILLAMLMPPTVPWWVLLIGVTVTIVVGKQMYGGIGDYPFHPAMVGWLVLLLAYDYHIRLVEHNSIAAVHPAVVLFTALGGVTLIALGHARWEVPVGVFVGTVAFWALFHKLSPENPKIGNLYEVITTTHLVLAAFFIATDSTSSPANSISGILFGLGAGALFMLIRTFGQWQDPVPFAIILMNILAPLLDKIRPKPMKVVLQNG